MQRTKPVKIAPCRGGCGKKPGSRLPHTHQRTGGLFGSDQLSREERERRSLGGDVNRYLGTLPFHPLEPVGVGAEIIYVSKQDYRIGGFSGRVRAKQMQEDVLRFLNRFLRKMGGVWHLMMEDLLSGALCSFAWVGLGWEYMLSIKRKADARSFAAPFSFVWDVGRKRK